MPGLDQAILDRVDEDLALRRIVSDVRSDFILAPHYSAVFANVGGDLWQEVASELRSGSFEFSLPITVDIPKRSGLTRQGAILDPYDRVVYQLLVDVVAPVAEGELNRNRVFSHMLQDPDPTGTMFQPSGQTWTAFQGTVQAYCLDDDYDYVVKADVAAFFERLYQHNLINLLQSVVAPAGAVNLLEKALLAWTEKDSHGILQGLFPSDYLGTFYLHGLDSYLLTQDTPFARYVDDIFAFYPSELQARRGLAELCRVLRHEGLNLNEAKSGIWTTEQVLYEETELDRMFSDARDEASSAAVASDWYNFQVTWTPSDDENDEDHELRATISLFERLGDDPFLGENQRDKIERFAIPLLAASRSHLAVEHSLNSFVDRPHMAQIYASYLGALARNDEEIAGRVGDLLENADFPHDWQVMWLAGTLLAASNIRTRVVNLLSRILSDGSRHPALRSVCAIAIGRHGNAGQRRMLRHRYAEEPSMYVRSAILYASRFFPASERRTAVSAWSGHSSTNALVGRAVQALVK